MLKSSKAGIWILRTLIRLLSVALMIVISAVQAVGIILTALSAVVLKGISAAMIFVTLLLQIFGLFIWTRTLVVLLIAASMFWFPEGLGLVLMGLAFLQAKILVVLDACR